MENKNCFDFLRFFFASNILLAHLAELSQSKNLEFLFNFSYSFLAVQGFFVISGFLVAKSYVNSPSIKEYFIKRAKRILPAYIVVLILSILILSIFSSYSFSEYFSDINVYKYLGWNFVFLNFMHPCLPGIFDNNLMCVVNGALWTLKVEEGFYVVLPLIFFAIFKSKRPVFILAILYLFSVIYWFVMDYLGQPLLAKQLPGYLAFFTTGISLFLGFTFVLKYKIKLLAIAILFLILSNYLNLRIDLFYPAAFGTLVIITSYSLPVFNNFGKYGDFTYGLYIYHFPIIQLFRHYNLFEKFNPILMAVFVILLSIVFAIISWFAIEKRFLERYKKLTVKPNIVTC